MKDSSALEQRQLERILLPRPILIRSDVLGYADSAAVLRDISAVGAYCYTFMPLTVYGATRQNSSTDPTL
jgi:hypothetical protein